MAYLSVLSADCLVVWSTAKNARADLFFLFCFLSQSAPKIKHSSVETGETCTLLLRWCLYHVCQLGEVYFN